MSGPLAFGWGCLRVLAGAERARLSLRPEDNGRDYGGRKLPLAVTVSVTHRCNLRCAHCQAENDLRKSDVPTGRMLELIDEMAAAGTVRVGFTGGEPLMRPDFGAILERCRSRGLIVSVVSNGYLVPRFVEVLRGTDLLFMSVDGNRAIHDRIRGQGAFDAFLAAAECARRNKIPVAALTTLMSHNADCLQEMADTFAGMGIHWMVSRVQTGFSGRSEQDLSPRQLADAVAVLRRAPCLRTSRRYLDFLVAGRPLARCYAGVSYAIMAPDGRLFPCFPAQFDHAAYDGGQDLLKLDFATAFRKLPLYRATCATCTLACHAEANFLQEINPESILQSVRLRCRLPGESRDPVVP